MPELKPAWENVALALAAGDPPKRAYEAGGFKYIPASASRFCRRPDVLERVAEIRAQRAEMDARARQVAAEESGVTLAWTQKHYKHIVLSGLRGDPVRAPNGAIRKDPETGAPIYKPDRIAAVKALDSLTRMLGGFIDRTEIGSPGDFSRMADDELDAAIVESAKDMGLPAPALKMLEHLTKKEISE